MKTITDAMSPGPAEGLTGLLGVQPPSPDNLPACWHWVYLLDRPRQEDLGRDGHPIRGGLLHPPGDRKRRMWAGGSVHTLGPLSLDTPAERTSRVIETVEKTGSAGTLVFSTVLHEISQRGRVVVEEHQRIVYRDFDPAAKPVMAEPAHRAEVAAAPEEWEIPVSPTLLFRFSALTYNGHRIHYDREYAREVEGYPGLITHGPLQALVMAELARARGVEPHAGLTFDYRLVAPLFDHQGLVVGIAPDGSDPDVSITQVRDRYGRLTATGRVTRQT